MKRKKVLFALIWFAIVQGLSIPIYFLILKIGDKTIASEIARIFSGIIFLILIFHIGRNNWIKLNIKITNKVQIKLIISVILLFALNNFFQKYYYKIADFEYFDLKKEFMFFFIGSCWEEITFRGFIQNYIDSDDNNNDTLRYGKLSYGIIVTTILFTLLHLHFFTIMPFSSAIISLFAVAYLSIIAGILMKETKSILLVCFLHLVVNFLHLIIQTY